MSLFCSSEGSLFHTGLELMIKSPWSADSSQAPASLFLLFCC